MRSAFAVKRSTSCSASVAGTEGAGPDGHSPASTPCVGSCPGSAIGPGPEGSEEGLGPKSCSGLDLQSASGFDGPGLTGESCKKNVGARSDEQSMASKLLYFSFFFGGKPAQ